MNSSYCAGYLEKSGCWTRHTVRRTSKVNGDAMQNQYVHFKVVENDGHVIEKVFEYLNKTYNIRSSFYFNTNTYEVNDIKSVVKLVLFMMKHCFRHDYLLPANAKILIRHFKRVDKEPKNNLKKFELAVKEYGVVK